VCPTKHHAELFIHLNTEFVHGGNPPWGGSKLNRYNLRLVAASPPGKFGWDWISNDRVYHGQTDRHQIVYFSMMEVLWSFCDEDTQGGSHQLRSQIALQETWLNIWIWSISKLGWHHKYYQVTIRSSVEIQLQWEVIHLHFLASHYYASPYTIIDSFNALRAT